MNLHNSILESKCVHSLTIRNDNEYYIYQHLLCFAFYTASPVCSFEV